MPENMMIIVTGAPATGKTTLSKQLAGMLQLPVINKDEIKELLFDNLGIKDREWAVKLGATSFELIYLLAEKLCQTGRPFIVEGNFENKYSTKSFLELKTKFDYEILQLYCHAQDEVLYKRYVDRDNSGNRHPGHIRMTNGFEGYKRMTGDKEFKLDIVGSRIKEIDTTKFEDINIKGIYEEVKKNIYPDEKELVWEGDFYAE